MNGSLNPGNYKSIPVTGKKVPSARSAIKTIQKSAEFSSSAKVRTTRNDVSNITPIYRPKFGTESKAITKSKGK